MHYFTVWMIQLKSVEHDYMRISDLIDVTGNFVFIAKNSKIGNIPTDQIFPTQILSYQIE